MQKSRTLLIILTVIALSVMMIAPLQTAAVEEYAPNRMITLHCVDNINPTFRVSLMYDNYMDAGPYTLIGKIKIENFADIAGNDLHKAFLDFYVPGGTPANKVNWTQNTGGWVDLKDGDGKFIKFDALADDTEIIFGLWYASGDVSLADFKIVDNAGNIVYSMANDPTLYGNTNTMLPVGLCPWSGSDYGSNKTSTITTTTNEPEYVPNTVLTIQPTVPVVLGTTSINPAFIIDSGNALFTDGGPFTVDAKIRLDDYGAIPDEANTPNVFLDPNLMKYYGNTNGWVSLLKADGQQLTFEFNSGWYILGEWYCTAGLSIADLKIYNAAGAVVYDMEADENFDGEGTYPPKSTVGCFYLWFYGAPDGVTFTYSNASTPTTHTRAQYVLPQFTETVTEFNDPTPTEVPPTAAPTDAENPQTGDSAGMSSYILLAVLIAAATSGLLVSKKVKA
ncbi:MAG: LPXTG cell wall anchor domain-containing protein [Saccharofermentanales bacterium]